VPFHALCATLGWIAVTIGVISTIAQLRRAYSVGIEGISLATWFMFSLLGCFWIAYGASVHSLIIAMGSLTVLPFQLVVIFRLKPWLRWPVIRRCAMFFAVFCVGPTLVWGWSVGVLGVGVVMIGTRLPQLIELARYRGAMGVSVGAWSLSTLGSLLWIVYDAGFHFWAAALVTFGSGVANVTIASLAGLRHRQRRQVVIREVIFAAS
jgi:uncharacterized protein with PQ loop repeat